MNQITHIGAPPSTAIKAKSYASYGDETFYRFVLYPTGLFFDLGVTGDGTRDDFYFSPYNFKIHSTQSSGGTIEELYMCCVERKIFTFYHNSGNVFTGTSSLGWGSTISGERTMYFTDYFSYSKSGNDILLILNGTTIQNVSKVLIIDPSLGQGEEKPYQNTSSFRNRYPLVKLNTGHYQQSGSASLTEGGTYNFLTEKGDCFSATGTADSPGRSKGFLTNFNMNNTNLYNDAPSSSVTGGNEVSSTYTQEPLRRYGNNFGIKANGTGHKVSMIAFSTQDMLGYASGAADDYFPKTAYSRTNPYILFRNDTGAHAGGSIDFTNDCTGFDQFTFVIYDDLFFRIPIGGTVRGYSREGATSLTVTNPIRRLAGVNLNYTYNETVHCPSFVLVANVGDTRGTYLLKAPENKTASYPSIALTTPTYHEYYGNRGSNPTSVTPQGSPFNLNFTTTLSLNASISNNEGTDFSIQKTKVKHYTAAYGVDYDYLSTEGKDPITIPLTVTMTVPMIPGIENASTEFIKYDPTATINLGNINGYKYGSDRFNGDSGKKLWRFTLYADSKGGTALGTSKLLFEIFFYLKGKAGILNNFETSMTSGSGSPTGGYYYTDSSHSSTGYLTSDRVAQDNGNVAATSNHILSEGNQHYINVIVAYPN